MTEVWFYHLEGTTLDRALPVLLEKTLERGWRAVVQAGSAERVDSLDSLLWTYDDASFLPHGTARDGDPALQPVWLTQDVGNPNGAAIRFMVDGADVEAALEGAPAPYERVVFLFDGNDEDAVTGARALWKRLKADERNLAYWRQTEDGRWTRHG